MAKKITPQQMSMFLSSMQKQKKIDNTSGIAPKKAPETKMDIEFIKNKTHIKVKGTAKAPSWSLK